MNLLSLNKSLAYVGLGLNVLGGLLNAALGRVWWVAIHGVCLGLCLFVLYELNNEEKRHGE